MTATKSVFKSWTNWLGVAAVLSGLGVYVDLVPKSWAPYLLGIAGLAAAVLRTFKTNTVTTFNGVPTTAPAPPSPKASG